MNRGIELGKVHPWTRYLTTGTVIHTYIELVLDVILSVWCTCIKVAIRRDRMEPTARSQVYVLKKHIVVIISVSL